MADNVARIADGVYRIERDGQATIVYIAGTADAWWAFCDGHVYRSAPPKPRPSAQRASRTTVALEVTAPMPAMIVTVNVAAGERVRKGDVLVVLDAMKMEMPLRADADAVVTTVRCRPGELVQADAVLVELE